MNYIVPMEESDIERLAALNVPLLIEGETGTGKTALVNELCTIAGKDIQRINVATLNDNLIESELFGHSKGAFTGAHQRRMGLLEKAHNKWVFLDEIAEINPQVQKKLLDFLQTGSFTPVGCNEERQINCRMIFATNANLEEMVERKLFRKDLYFRIRQAYIKLQPLRDTPVFLINLYESYKVHYNLVIDEESENILLSYSWPGNIRELSAVMDLLSQLSVNVITKAFLPTYIHDSGQTSMSSPLALPKDFKSYKAYCEKVYLSRALKRFGGMINRTSREIKISKGTLLQKIKQYEIDVDRIRSDYHQKIKNLENEVQLVSIIP